MCVRRHWADGGDVPRRLQVRGDIPAQVVICENVGGLLKRSLGAEPQILAVQAAFIRLGYTFQHVAVDTRDFFLPHRRQRVWMWALRDGAQSQADQIKAVIHNLPKRPPHATTRSSCP